MPKAGRNDLVNTADGEKINDFLYEMLFQNEVLSKPEDVIGTRRRSGLIKILNSVQNVLQKKEEKVKNIIDPVNDSQKNILRIIYSQNGIYEDPNFAFWLFGKKYDEKEWYRKYNLTNSVICSK